jgi:hypothetical protein
MFRFGKAAYKLIQQTLHALIALRRRRGVIAFRRIGCFGFTIGRHIKSCGRGALAFTGK